MAKKSKSHKKRERPRSRFPKRRRGGEPNELDGLIVHGTFALTSDGHGRVRPEMEIGLEEIFVPAESFGGAGDGNHVTVKLSVGRKGKVKGTVLASRDTRDRTFVGVVQTEGKSFVIFPEPPEGPTALVAANDLNGARARDAVVAEIIGSSVSGSRERARVLEVIGHIDDPKVQVELVVRSSGWPMGFEDDVLQEAAAFDDVDPNDALVDGRRDLRTVTHVTIDGADARDFDDAVACVREGEMFRVWVSIADVSHYVRPGTALDRSARMRSTSVYFPDRVLPMLPERLSNDLCSLRPHLPRLAMTCEMRVDGEGRVHDAEVYPSLIQSAARLTYMQVQAELDLADGKPGAVDPGPASDHHALLVCLRSAARAFRAQRSRRGALELDLPESMVKLNGDGVAVGIGRRTRTESHRLIEDLMIGANEASARFAEAHEWPVLYRVHEAPNVERLHAAAEWASRFGTPLDVDEIDEPQNLAAFIDATRELEASDVIHMLTLRSMAQARYGPDNLGHYGLASDAYLHFTSPIRRYPDLFVHRSLRAKLARQRRPGIDLDALGVHCSTRERTAMDAERTVIRLMECQVAQRFIGSTMEVMVTGVHSAGAFVRAERPRVEGLMPIRTLSEALGDYFDLDEGAMAYVSPHSGRRLGVGDRFIARLVWVDIARRHIDFAPEKIELPIEGESERRSKRTPRPERAERRGRKANSRDGARARDKRRPNERDSTERRGKRARKKNKRRGKR